MKMNYFVFGISNMEASIKFYDSLFENLKLNRVSPTERMTYWLGENFTFAIALPFNNEPASNGNGTMVGFDVGSTEEVKRLHTKAIDLGGTSEGEPNLRGPYYSAYVRDLDKNKICLFEQRI